MITKPGAAQPKKLFREMAPGETFQSSWKGKARDYLTSDLTRAEPTSEAPWDYRAAIDLARGEAVWMAATRVVFPTNMKAGPA